MSEQIQTAAEPELDELLERDDLLRRRLDIFPKEIAGDSEERKDFIVDSIALFRDLREFAVNIRTTAEFEKLNRIAGEWQSIYSSVLGIPQDIREAVGLPERPIDLEPTPRRIESEEVLRFLRGRALQVSRDRKLCQLNNLLSRILRQPDIIDEAIISSDQERQADWYSACLFLASDVLDGSIRFADQLDFASFEHLEGVWLDDVKRLMAYLIWEHEGQVWDPHNKQDHYHLACQRLHERLMDPKLRARPKCLGLVLDWFTARYFDKGFPALSKPELRRVTEAKAHKISQLAPTGTPEGDWRVADDFVQTFYRHIVPAIRDKSKDSTYEVLAAVRSAGAASVDVVNGLEAAMMLYGLDRDAVRQDYNANQSYV